MSNKQFNEKYINPIIELYNCLDSFNKGFYVVIPQSISRCYFFSSNNVYSVFVALLSWMNEKGQCNVSRSILGEHARIGDLKTVDKAISELVSKGFILKKKNTSNNENEANTYILNDLTKNPFLILSEALYTVKKNIKTVSIAKAVKKLIQQLNKEQSASPLIKKIESEANKDMHTAFNIACEGVVEHFRKELGIDVSFTPTKKKNPTTKAGKKKENTNAIPKRNREWTGEVTALTTPRIKKGCISL